MLTSKNRGRRAAAGAACLALSLPCFGMTATAADSPNESDSFSSQRIARGGDGEFGNYRIPAVVQLNNGDVLVAYDGRPTGIDAPGPNSILMRRSSDGGRSFGPQTVVAAGKTDAPIEGYSDPSFVYDRETGDLFIFSVFSKDTGFWNSTEGNDDADRSVMSAVVSVSHDNGQTWERRSMTQTVKPAGVRAVFATSGHGIQIQNGPYAGRLVQQYVGAFTDGSVRAYSVYSDDHGATWTMGAPVGTKMDENKVVELSDGRLMLNSRAHDSVTARWVAYSGDGGATWSEPELDHTLVDPRNNASIIRMHPDAADGSRESKELLFSNANSATGRENGSLRYSCDNGKTWPTVTTFNSGPTSYSDLVALKDGTYGIMFEGANSEQLYGSFAEGFVGGFCANFGAADAEIDAGSSAPVTFTLRNDDDRVLPAGEASVSLPTGWTATPVSTPALEPGESTDVTVTVTAPNTAAKGTIHGDVKVQAGDIALRGDLNMTVANAAPAQMGATITGYVRDTERDADTNPYEVGEKIRYSFRVTSTANVTQTLTPLSGNMAPLVPPESGNCRWRNLAPGRAFTCPSPALTVTQEDLDRGFIIPQSSWEFSSTGMESVTVDVTGDEVSLRERTPALSTEAPTIEITDSEIILTYAVTNTGNVPLTGVTVNGEPLVDDLAAGASASYTARIPRSSATGGSLTAPALTVQGHNGSKPASATHDAVEVDVPGGDDTPSEPTNEPTIEPSEEPTEEPSVEPSSDPSEAPRPGADPTTDPTRSPSTDPSSGPVGEPSDDASGGASAPAPSHSPEQEPPAGRPHESSLHGFLPRTGAAVAGVLAAGVALTAAGGALLRARKRH